MERLTKLIINTFPGATVAKLKLEGRIIRVGKVHQSTKSDFKWKNFLLETGDEKYPNPVNMQTSGKYLDAVNESMVDSQATVEFFINGRRTDKGYYNTLNAVSVTCENAQQNSRNPTDDFVEDDIPF